MKSIFALSLMLAVTANAQRPQNDPPEIPGARVEVYKTIGEVKLRMYLFMPDHFESGPARPAIVFFFGGGWRGGTPKQFEHQGKYLASRGMIAMAADYRVSSRQHTKALQCVMDGKSAIRWARAHAGRFNIDPQRIVASGGSAGGHVAACSGILKGLEEPAEDTSISSAPNAMILFNPAVILAPVEGRPLPQARLDRLRDRLGTAPEELSPYHHLRAGIVPTLILHGQDDTTVPYATVMMFTTRMKQLGNRCELAGFEGQSHGFFNFVRSRNRYFIATLKRADQFLSSLGYLDGKETVEAYLHRLE